METAVVLASFILLSACVNNPKNSSANVALCNGSERSPAAVQCKKIFNNSTPFIQFLERANQLDSGLQQTTFTSYSGQVLKPGAASPKINKSQIVSFFFSKYADGSLNRCGTQVQGTPTEIIFDRQQNPAYIIFANQAVRLLEHTAYMNVNHISVIKGQGYQQHAQGFSSPIGLVKNVSRLLSEIPIAELKELLSAYTDKQGVTTIQFESGVVVKGEIENYTENNLAKFGVANVISFKEGTAKVTFGDRLLFDHHGGCTTCYWHQ